MFIFKIASMSLNKDLNLIKINAFVLASRKELAKEISNCHYLKSGFLNLVISVDYVHNLIIYLKFVFLRMIFYFFICLSVNILISF